MCNRLKHVLKAAYQKVTKVPKKGLFLFPQEMKTGITPTWLIIEKNVPLKEGNSVKVNWARKKVEAEILALHSKSEIV